MLKVQRFYPYQVSSKTLNGRNLNVFKPSNRKKGLRNLMLETKLKQKMLQIFSYNFVEG